MCALAAAVLAAAWASTPPLGFDLASLQNLLVAVGLAGLYPIYLQYRTKVLLTTPPLYLVVTLLPLGAAGIKAGSRQRWRPWSNEIRQK